MLTAKPCNPGKTNITVQEDGNISFDYWHFERTGADVSSTITSQDMVLAVCKWLVEKAQAGETIIDDNWKS